MYVKKTGTTSKRDVESKEDTPIEEPKQETPQIEEKILGRSGRVSKRNNIQTHSTKSEQTKPTMSEDREVSTEDTAPMEVEKEPSSSPVDVSANQDGGVMKEITKAAPEGARGPPPSGSKVKAHYTGTLVSDGSKFDSSVDRGEPFEFTLGQGQVIKGWDDGFASMKVGEHATLTIRSDYGYGDNGSPPKIPQKADLKFDVELLDYTEGDDTSNEKKQKWDMSAEEKKAEAESLKEQGTKLFKEQNYKEASEKYTEAAEFIHDEDEGEEGNDIAEDSKELYINCHNNAAMCLLKIKSYGATVTACSSVLKVDNKNVKALYRRGVALTKTEDFSQARKDLAAAYNIDKDNKAVRKAYNDLKVNIAAAKQKEKNMFANMFDKVSMYDDKKTADVHVIPNEKGDNPHVYFDVAQGDNKLGRIVMQLYMDVTPKTAGNFKAICTGDNKDKLTYKKSIFHRVIKDFMIQGGDITNADGTGGKSIYGEKFEDENFNIKHTKAGLLSMANSGKNTNGSQFFITSKETPHLDGKHCVFGEVVEGMDVVRLVEDVEKGESDKPKEDIVIEDCGEINWKKSDSDNVVNEVTDEENDEVKDENKVSDE